MFLLSIKKGDFVKKELNFFVCIFILAFSGALYSQVYNNGYYDNISPLKSAFIQDIESRIRNPYVKYGYSDYDNTVLANYECRDTTGGKKVITCVYTGENYVYTPPFAWGTYSREHTWCHSWMPTYDSESGPEYSDQHHLFPANQNNANGQRSNHPLGKVATVTYQYLEGKLGKDVNGGTVYEPRNAHKGDAARAILYMALRYDGVNGTWNFNWLNNRLASSGETSEDLATLLEWNKQDPPDRWEIKRNNYIESIQKNRNPFVDHPEYANYIDFTTLTYKTPVLADEPANQLTNLTAASTDSSITLKWIDALPGAQQPAGYFITIYKDSNFVIPVDGYVYQEQTDISKGNLTLYVPYSAIDSMTVFGLPKATPYLFTAYSYNGEGNLINYNTTGVIPQVYVKTTGKAAPSAGFVLQSASVSEGAGQYTLQVSISSTADLSSEATVNVSLKSGDSKYINGFTSKTVTFSPNGPLTIGIPLGILDDGILEGTRDIVFSLQSITSNVIISQGEFTLNIIDNDGVFGGRETFANFPETGQSYLNGTFKGQDGSTWSYALCSGNSAGNIDGHNPVMKKDAGAKVESGIIPGGCGKLIFKYMQAFSANVDLSVYVNNAFVKKVASNSEVSKVKESDTIDVSVEGPFTFKFQQSSSTSGQVSLGDIRWTGYSIVSVNDDVKLPDAFLLEQNYPNPFNPETTIGYTVPAAGNVSLKVFNPLGQEVSMLVNEYKPAGKYTVKFSGKDLTSGVYFYRLTCGSFTVSKKLILQK
jgi:endonuclease I